MNMLIRKGHSHFSNRALRRPYKERLDNGRPMSDLMKEKFAIIHLQGGRLLQCANIQASQNHMGPGAYVT